MTEYLCKQLIGELAWLSKNTRSASVIIKQACKLLIIPVRDLQKFYVEHSEVAQAITAKLAEQVSRLSVHLQTVVLGDINQRVMWALKKLRS